MTDPFLPPGDVAHRRRALADSMDQKAAQLARLHRSADHNGRISQAEYDEARNPTPAPPPAEPPMPGQLLPEPAVPVENLHPAVLPHPPRPTLADQIAEAEQAGDWATARQLKAELLLARHAEMNGETQ